MSEVVGHKGTITRWNGSFRKSIFYNLLGEEFVEIAFKAAHEADENAKLYINDFNLDDPQALKTLAMIAKVQAWREVSPFQESAANPISNGAVVNDAAAQP